MKHVLMIITCVLLLGGGFWLGQNLNADFAVVDMNQIIHQTAEALAKKDLKPDQVQLQIVKFKTDLQKSLTVFAQKNKLLIAPTSSLFGNVKDYTEDFIRFYNEEIPS